MLRLRLIAIGFGALAVLGACTQDDPVVEPPDETSEVTDAPDTAAGVTVAIADSDLGEILVDGDGRTLYVFNNDTDGESTCTDACAQTWPPLLVDGEAEAGDGADASLIGTTEREDGDTQVTYGGKPLYHYAADEADGDTKGQGVGGVWYVVGADGEPIED